MREGCDGRLQPGVRRGRILQQFENAREIAGGDVGRLRFSNDGLCLAQRRRGDEVGQAHLLKRGSPGDARLVRGRHPELQAVLVFTCDACHGDLDTSLYLFKACKIFRARHLAWMKRSPRHPVIARRICAEAGGTSICCNSCMRTLGRVPGRDGWQHDARVT